MRLPSALRGRFDGLRGLALLAAVALLSAVTGTLYTFVDVAGGVQTFTIVVAGALVAATVTARFVRVRWAVLVALVALVAGMALYLESLPYSPEIEPIVQSNVELLTGASIHQIRQSGVWATGVAPAPLFTTWYLALRRHYGAAVLAGGALLGYLVLTGDATLPITLLGVVGAIAMLAFGDLERHGGSAAGAEYAAIGLAVMVIIPLVVAVVPASLAGPSSLAGGAGGSGGSQTLEASLLDAQERFQIQGTISLSPRVRFTIDSEAGRYWKARGYDRYTGDGWAVTGATTPLNETTLPYPEGDTEIVSQRVSTESQLTTVPAAWRPVEVGDTIAGEVGVTSNGDITLSEPLPAGEAYRIRSAIRTAAPESLDDPVGEDPDDIVDRYTGLPESTPDRVAERTANITADAETRYETARRIEGWLESNREYSLDVDRPDGNIADGFLFEMRRGYCTYFATSMVVMLRSGGIPARLATGYTTGQHVGQNRWVVRGLDAHAWVEVYFPDEGWVAFDPTPAGPRQQAEAERIDEARESNASEVDTNESAQALNRTDPFENTTQNPLLNPNITPDNETSDPSATVDDGQGPLGGTLPDVPPREQVALGLVFLVGAAAGVRRSGLARWLVRTGRVQWQRRHDPATDVEIAFRRAAIVIERAHRPREAGETVRQYLDAIDAPRSARRIAEIRERATYAGQVDQEQADEAVSLVEDLRAVYER